MSPVCVPVSCSATTRSAPTPSPFDGAPLSLPRPPAYPPHSPPPRSPASPPTRSPPTAASAGTSSPTSDSTAADCPRRRLLSGFASTAAPRPPRRQRRLPQQPSFSRRLARRRRRRRPRRRRPRARARAGRAQRRPAQRSPSLLCRARRSGPLTRREMEPRWSRDGAEHRAPGAGKVDLGGPCVSSSNHARRPSRHPRPPRRLSRRTTARQQSALHVPPCRGSRSCTSPPPPSRRSCARFSPRTRRLTPAGMPPTSSSSPPQQRRCCEAGGPYLQLLI